MRFLRRGSDEAPEKDPVDGGQPAGARSPLTDQAETFVTIMRDLAPQLSLDYSPDSLAALDAFISQTFEGPAASPAPESLQVDAGAYVGEVVRRHLGGTWGDDGSLRQVGGEVSEIRPISKARKRFANGTEDSLAWFYEVVRRHVSGEASG